MKQLIKIFEDFIEGEGNAAVESPRPGFEDNYALKNAEDFHISEILGEMDTELDQRLQDDEAKSKARKEIAEVWSKAIHAWAHGDM